MDKIKRVINLSKNIEEKGHVCLCKSNTWMPSTNFYNRGLNQNILMSDQSTRYWKPAQKVRIQMKKKKFIFKKEEKRK